MGRLSRTYRHTKKSSHTSSTGIVLAFLVVCGLIALGWKLWSVGLVGAQATNPPFVFTAAGDYDDNAASTEPTFASIRALAPTFHLALGDLSYDFQTSVPEQAWCDYVKNPLRLGTNIPMLLLSGNHENNAPNPPVTNGDGEFIDNFAVATCFPKEHLEQATGTTVVGDPNIGGPYGGYPRAYYFDYGGNTRFIMISPGVTGEAEHDYAVGDPSYLWLQTAIRDAKAAGKWVIVGMHKNCITMGEKGCEAQEPVSHLLVNEKVDLVMQGHDHTYQRSHQLLDFTQNGCSPSPSCFTSQIADDGMDGEYPKGAGTVIVVAGTGGRTNLYNINTGDSERQYFAKYSGNNDNPTYGHLKVTVTDSQLSVQFVNTAGLSGGGTFTDSFVIGQSGPTGTPTETPLPTTPPTPTPVPTTVTLKYNSGLLEDARVELNAPTTSYASSYLRANGGTSNATRSYLKFDLTPYAGRTVVSAKLRMKIRTATSSETTQSHLVHRVDTNAWSESSVTWNAQPGYSAQLAVLQPGSQTAWIETIDDSDLTNLATFAQENLGQQMTLALGPCAGCADGVNYEASDSPTNPNVSGSPELILTFVAPTPADGATNTPTPAFTLTPTPDGTPSATPIPTSTPTPTSGVSPSPTQAQSVLTFPVLADATIRSTNPSTNYGNTTVLDADLNPEENFLMKFSVSGTSTKQIINAKLRLYVTNGSGGSNPSGGTFYSTVDNSWLEIAQGQTPGVTWNTAPALGTEVASLANGNVTAGTFVEVDVTGANIIDGLNGFRVNSTSADGVGYASKQTSNSSRRPQLIITVQ